MKVIDFRFRPNTPDAVEGVLKSKVFGDMGKLFNVAKHLRGESLEQIIANMDAHNVVHGVITGRDAETTYGLPNGNMGIAAFVKQHPTRFSGIAGLDPHKGMKALDELTRMVTEHGFKGAATDPYLAKIPANHAKFYPIYAKCCELNVPVVITTGPATLVADAVMEHAAPRYIDAVATDFPELKIVISHGCYPWVNEAIMVVHRHKNVYMECAEYEAAPFANGYVEAANTLIGDKLMFASAHPFFDFRDRLAVSNSLPFTPEVRENVLYKNAARLLGLSV
ncbi:amidohydrolase family protein [Humidesulfovibrio idahonensis]